MERIARGIIGPVLVALIPLGAASAQAAGFGLLVLFLAFEPPVHAQARPKSPGSTPGIVAAPTSLTAWSNTPGQVGLAWPAVTGAEKYRLTRIESTANHEVTIEELPRGSFVLEGAACIASSSQPGCAYQDGTKAPSEYPHTVVSGKVYKYRVWAIFSGAVISSPSAPATVLVK